MDGEKRYGPVLLAAFASMVIFVFLWPDELDPPNPLTLENNPIPWIAGMFGISMLLMVGAMGVEEYRDWDEEDKAGFWGQIISFMVLVFPVMAILFVLSIRFGWTLNVIVSYSYVPYIVYRIVLWIRDRASQDVWE